MSTEVCAADLQQFNASRRAGRRNAMADLNVEGMDPEEARKLTEQFAQMGHDDEEDGPSTSGNGDEGFQK